MRASFGKLRCCLTVLAALSDSACAPVSAPPSPTALADARAELIAARRAHDAHDSAQFLAHAERAAQLRPDGVGPLYTLACAHALLGHAELAGRPLLRLAQLRIYFDLAVDDDFAPIRETAAYRQARAALERVRSERLGDSTIAFTLSERDLLTEGLAHDGRSGDFYLSSVHKRKIVRVAKDGTVSDFVAAGRDGLWAVFAVAVDPGRRSLFALTAPCPEMRGYDAREAGATGVLEYDLATAALRRKVIVADGTPRAFNDLVVAADGTVYIGDGQNGAIVTLLPGAQTVTPFIAPGVFHSTQGLALSADGRALYAADYGSGLARIDLSARAVAWLAPPSGTTLAGVDGMVAHGRYLVVTQNGIAPPRVVRLTVSSDGTRLTAAKILELNDPRADEPTLGTMVGGDFFYIANSHWGSFDKSGAMWPVERLAEPMVLKTRVD